MCHEIKSHEGLKPVRPLHQASKTMSFFDVVLFINSIKWSKFFQLAFAIEKYSLRKILILEFLDQKSISQPAITCSMLAIETPEQGVKDVQS